MDKEVVFQEFPEDFDNALEPEQSGVSDYWGVGFGEYFVKRR